MVLNEKDPLILFVLSEKMVTKFNEYFNVWIMFIYLKTYKVNISLTIAYVNPSF